MRLPTPSITSVPIPSHIQALADQFMSGAQSRFGHGVWSMNAEDGADGGGDGGDGSDGTDGAGAGAGDEGGSQGRDLGFPANTPVAEMTEAQQAAYWRHESKKHQGRYATLTGGRSFDETKADLAELARIRQEQQTPAEKALQERYEAGKKDAAAESSTKAAEAILRIALDARGVKDADLDEVIDLIDVRKFIAADGDIDTDRLAAAANRFGSGTQDDGGRGGRRDFGAGRRGSAGGKGPRAGSAEADRRFGAPQQ